MLPASEGGPLAAARAGHCAALLGWGWDGEQAPMEPTFKHHNPKILFSPATHVSYSGIPVKQLFVLRGILSCLPTCCPRLSALC